jgi:hypothetical protein
LSAIFLFQNFIFTLGRFMALTSLSTIFQFIVAVSFIGGGNLSTWRKPLTCHKSRTNFITQCCIEYTSPATSHWQTLSHNVVSSTPRPVPYTTKVVSLNLDHGEVYSIQHCVIKFVSDLWQVSGFSILPHCGLCKTTCTRG